MIIRQINLKKIQWKLYTRHFSSAKDVISRPVIFLKHNLKGFLYFHKHHNIIWPVDSGSWLLVTPWFLNYVFLCCPQFFSQDVLFQLHLVQLMPLSLGRNWPSLRSLMTSLQLSQGPVPFSNSSFPHLFTARHPQPSPVSRNAFWSQLHLVESSFLHLQYI